MLVRKIFEIRETVDIDAMPEYTSSKVANTTVRSFHVDELWSVV
jgi:hypothetical protein